MDMNTLLATMNGRSSCTEKRDERQERTARVTNRATDQELRWWPDETESCPTVSPNNREQEALSVLMLCAPNKRSRPFSYDTKMADFEYFRVLSVFFCKNWHKLRRVY